ncbi:MAG TPA: hypothetical protein VK671_10795 [Mucilaginibacter sp.]|jgi:hypothetical protein|nr:hypothetical protein [Mucilaginibacter sp.]
MSKDKGGKNVKKAAGTGGKKVTSDYQASKQIHSRDELGVSNNKK